MHLYRAGTFFGPASVTGRHLFFWAGIFPLSSASASRPLPLPLRLSLPSAVGLGLGLGVGVGPPAT
jgi:hypothetical protein